MNQLGLYILRTLYCFTGLILTAMAIKAVQHSTHPGGIELVSVWTDESVYYIALVSFVFSAVMYQADKNNRNVYLIVFGFSLCFLNVFTFQLLGIGLVLLGLIFQFVLSIRKKESNDI